MPLKTIEDLFVRELSDAYSMEKQMTRSLPRLARAASDPELAAAFESHLEETRAQVERLDRLAEQAGLRLKRVKCTGMEGLIEEGLSLVDEVPEGPVLDAALIGASQKVEHYEIAAYASLITMARQLGHDGDALALLQESLQEERACDERLGSLAQAQAVEDAAQDEAAGA